MILKEHDDRKQDIEKLKSLLSLNISDKQRFLIEREIYSIKKGENGEKDSAYYINFYYKDSKNWIVIHDLRIELNGNAAQIDHILINKFFDIYVLESKNYKYGLRITKTGEFEAWYKGRYIGIASPLEQNKRHIEVLSKFIKHHNLAPKRLGIKIKPNFFSYILVSPQARIIRPPAKIFDSSNIIKADTLNTVIDKRAEKISTQKAIVSLSKIVSFETIEEFGKKLVLFHKPLNTDWKKRFKISDESEKSKNNNAKERYFCAMCKKPISKKEAAFCWNNKKRFKGKAYCYNCQNLVK